VLVSGQWPAAGAVRRVGECQVCHAPMGRDDGTGTAIPKLLERAGRQLCDTCHTSGGPAGAADIASLAYPSSETSQAELVAVWGAGSMTPTDAVAAVYGRATTGSDPRPLVGPREFAASNSGGVAAAGDVDDDGAAELLVADRAAKGLRILQRDALLGLIDQGVVSIGITPDLVAIGRFVDPGVLDPFSTTRPQIAVVDTSTAELYVYANTASSVMATIAGPYSVGTTPNGIASGEVTGTPQHPDLVVTDAANRFFVLAQNVPDSSDLVVASIVTSASTAPRGPSIGDVNTATGIEIVLCLTGTNELAVYDASGAPLDSVVLAGGTGGAVPWASAVANVLPGVTPFGRSGLEIAVAMRSEAGLSRLAVVAEAAGPATGLDGASVLYYDDTPARYRSGSVAVADVDGYGAAETILGNAGVSS
jgi:predicted CXXCH cytochrome family protein